MAYTTSQLQLVLEKVLCESITTIADRGELTLVLPASSYVSQMLVLRDHPETLFTQNIDLCGVDYLSFKNQVWEGKRFAAVSHLLSLEHNTRLRVRVFCEDDDFPILPSVVGVWSSVNWFEREAFDLYGIMFEGHPDLRRILTDYGFVGHPFRKDFPISGHLEMRYDESQKRVIYQPVTIAPREITPRIVREGNYAE